MEKKSSKQSLISKVDELSRDREFWERMKEDRRASKEGKLGSTNIRSVATVCENADCFEELRLYIEYKISKGNGWNEKIKLNPENKSDRGQVFGRVVINHMEEIYKECDRDDDKALKMIGLYFGYLFWRKAAIEKGDYLWNIKGNKTGGR